MRSPRASRSLVEGSPSKAALAAERGIGVYSDPARDPRGHSVSTAYGATLERPVKPQPGLDAEGAEWISDVRLAFNQAEILAGAQMAEGGLEDGWRRAVPPQRIGEDGAMALNRSFVGMGGFHQGKVYGSRLTGGRPRLSSSPASTFPVTLDVVISSFGNLAASCSFLGGTFSEESVMGRAILLWLLGVPIPIIILLALLWH